MAHCRTFFNGFDALLEHIRTSFGKQATLESPSFYAKSSQKVLLYSTTSTLCHIVGFAMLGMIKAAGRRSIGWMWKWTRSLRNCAPMVQTQAIVMASLSLSDYVKMLISRRTFLREHPKDPADLRISINTFCRAFPFHLMFDPHMSVLQLGEGLRKQLRCDTHKVLKFEDCFEIISPKVNATFERVLLRLSTPFVIRTKPEASSTENKDKVSGHVDMGERNWGDFIIL